MPDNWAAQLQVEQHFRASAGLVNYWLGMYKLSTFYIWVDNGFIGYLTPRRASPYVHVWFLALGP
jgi:hypothetical protein